MHNFVICIKIIWFVQLSSGFGSTAQQPAANTGGLFGASASAGGGGGSLFGQPSGAGAFGSAVGAQGGTTVAFNAPAGEDTMMKNQQQTKINTKHQCITAMREYENKSIEVCAFICFLLLFFYSSDWIIY